MVKTVAVPAAIAIFAGLMIGGTGPAQSAPIGYAHSKDFYMKADDGYHVPETDGPISIQGLFVTSTSGASVQAWEIDIFNFSDHAIVVDVDRWEAADGSPVERGKGGTIGIGEELWWNPTDYISFSESPIVAVHVYAKSRPGMGGTFVLPAKPIRNRLTTTTVSTASIADPASPVPEPSSIWIMLTSLVGLIGYHWRSRLFPCRAGSE